MSKRKLSTSNNAFSVLMTAAASRQQNKKKRQQQKGGSNFVLCPVGCGRHIPPQSINQHVDRCLLEQEQKETAAKKCAADGLSQEISIPEVSQNSVAEEGEKQVISSVSTPEKTTVMESCSAMLVSEEKTLPCRKEISDFYARMTESCRNHEKKEQEADDEESPQEVHKNNAATDTTAEIVHSSADLNMGDSMTATEKEDEKTRAILSPIQDEPSSPNAANATSEVIHSSTSLDMENLTPGKEIAFQKSTTDTKEEEKPRTTLRSPRKDEQQSSPNATDKKKDAFAHMMSQSKTVFAKREKIIFKQCLHLNSNGTVSLFLDQSQPVDSSRVAWSAMVKVNDKATTERPSASTLEVTISSSIPNIETNTRLVRRHSRLSVPVLKSILQKSIRRRRPLPAVRVAMELADKSLGDLLRRLPVIVLEDSTLHPDLGLLVWLMMAHSKDFHLTAPLLTRVFEIIFEIASCQWLDDSGSEIPATNNSSIRLPCTLISLLSNGDDDDSCSALVPSEGRILLWSMLVRAEYGGMRGDIRMLREYGDLWMHRFCQPKLDDRIAKGIIRSTGSSSVVPTKWSEIPLHIHQRARVQAQKKIPALTERALDRIGLEDICVEGVDFHCSNVLDTLLSDQPFCELCLDLLKLGGQNNQRTEDEVPQDDRSWLASILKQCMWTYCSGVNRRLPLQHSFPQKEAPAAKGPFYEIWKELVAPRVASFQKSYIEKRLVAY